MKKDAVVCDAVTIVTVGAPEAANETARVEGIVVVFLAVGVVEVM